MYKQNGWLIVENNYLWIYTFYVMDDTQKMLQAIINGQGTLKQELLSKIDRVDKKVDAQSENLGSKIDGLDKKVDRVEKNLTSRLDKIGKQLAYLEDDTPTKEEFDNLEKRVDNIEQKAVPAL